MQQDIQNRVADFMQSTLGKHRSEHMVVVTHGSILGAIEQYMTQADMSKILAKPYAKHGIPTEHYYDHEHKAQMDLHKHRIDSIVWPNHNAESQVDVTFMRHGQTDYNVQEMIQGRTRCATK